MEPAEFRESEQNPFRSPAEASVSPAAFKPSERTTLLMRQTRPWVLFLGIIGFIMVGFMMIATVGVLGASISGVMGAEGVFIAIIYGVSSVLYIFPALFLIRYSSRIRAYLDDGSVSSLDEALAAQKSFWKFLGVLTLVVICLYVVMLLFLAVGAGFAAFSAA